jgi:hypothetical protein
MTAGSKSLHQTHNAVPLLECTIAPTGEELARIGAILIKFGQHRHWGISRTHRHHELHSNEMMVHQVNRRTDICKPVQFGSLDELHPHSWHYTSARHLTPYEYGTCPRPGVPQSFISELWEQLERMSVKWSVSLFPLEAHHGRDKKWVEVIDSEARSMTSRLVSQAHDDPRLETVGWRFFRADEGAVEVASARQCQRNPVTGFHKAVYT